MEKLKKGTISPLLINNGEMALISQPWFKHAEKLTLLGQALPELDNSFLFSEAGKLREGLVENEDFVMIPMEIFDQVFSGDDASKRQLVKRKIIQNVGIIPHPIVEIYPPTFEVSLNVSAAAGADFAASGKDSRRVVQMDSCLQSLMDLFQKLDISSSLDDIRLWHSPNPNPASSYSLVNFIVSNAATTTLRSLSLDKYLLIDFFPFSFQPSVSSVSSVSAPGAWPHARFSFPSNKPSRTAGTTGLSNLGNTCFMNSALQCLSNSQPLTQYFLSGAFRQEINVDNPLGMGGEVAESYGRLVGDIWRGDSAVVSPRDFKSTIGRFAPQFTGYQQHDSQELTAFLLDGLHEDLNRVKIKPYTPTPSFPATASTSDPAALASYATTLWNIHKMRNDSVVVDCFQGQYKSTLVCPDEDCGFVSVTFDPFMYLTLPLPIQQKVRLDLVYVASSALVKPVKISNLMMPGGATLGNVKEKIAQQFGGNSQCLVVVELFSNKVFKIFTDDELVSDIGKSDVIFVYQGLVPVLAERQKKGYLLSDSSSEAPTQPSDIQVPPSLNLFVTMETEKPKTGYLSSYSTTTEFGYPVYVTVASRISYSDLYDVVVEQVQRLTKVDMSHGFEANVDTQLDKFLNAADEKVDGEISLEHKDAWFEIRMGSKDSFSRNGKLRVDPESEMLTFMPGDSLMIFFPADSHKLLFSPENSLMESADELPSQDAKESKRTPTLYQCFEEFAKTEKLGHEDAWYCPKCKQHKEASKKLDIWRAADILVVHLKRFSQGRYSRNKIEALIDFPLEGLDLSEMVLGHDAETDGRLEYDLYAVSNHMGGMGGGHYTAFARNPVDGCWYDFDDSRVSKMEAADVKTSMAYLLFYQRRTSRRKLDIQEQIKVVDVVRDLVERPVSASVSEYYSPVVGSNRDDDVSTPDIWNNDKPPPYEAVVTSGGGGSLNADLPPSELIPDSDNESTAANVGDDVHMDLDGNEDASLDHMEYDFVEAQSTDKPQGQD